VIFLVLFWCLFGFGLGLFFFFFGVGVFLFFISLVFFVWGFLCVSLWSSAFVFLFFFFFSVFFPLSRSLCGPQDGTVLCELAPPAYHGTSRQRQQV